MDIIKEPKNGGAPCPQKLDEEEECNSDKCKGSLKTFLSPSGDLGIGLVRDNPTPPDQTAAFWSDC